mmetsp:Transcript_5108/g.6941  ORF Transcript_5108/g.6941 Transcript_5108/m.6941 type:complete len:198 (+) Transcript_5108:97-690(+)|eukprot:CAMPEP_0196594158 /NCGR_PEP_ID=MMETSP1081-20130531/77494_1 /TAXON_ID=36882 /ORGANISM="Pyramimonas amylifera, Strain CCMP720" /LENGTH=197 /DNA_ID=CAMNT_0041918335 /DNA_START=80 /DNA_END=673 /DNA_ORIENTATION=+
MTMSMDDSIDGDKTDLTNYREEGVLQTVRTRGGWLFIFFLGLIGAAVVVERFEHVLRQEVELSYFVPLLIGHGGNTGSQSVATVIRAIALGHLKPKHLMFVMAKESSAGLLMGAGLGVLIFLISLVWDGISPRVGVTVAISLPVVSLWANLLGGVFPLVAVWFGYNPAVTSAPLMTTVVDSSGLVIYFLIAKMVLRV